jgi:hypothetical protein
MRNGVRRSVAAMTVFLVMTPVLLAQGASGQPSQHRNRAGIVIQHSDIGILTDCVEFKEAKIDGVALLDRSRFEFFGARDQFGTGICWIDGEGCKTTDPSECFCTPVRSWSYWVQERDDPVFDHADTYASGRVVRDGSVDYWTFGPHGMPPVGAPKTVEEICS